MLCKLHMPCNPLAGVDFRTFSGGEQDENHIVLIFCYYRQQNPTIAARNLFGVKVPRADRA